jgi:hypothetical protein
LFGGKQINVFFLEMFDVAQVVNVHTKMDAKITITNKALETFLLWATSKTFKSVKHWRDFSFVFYCLKLMDVHV